MNRPLDALDERDAGEALRDAADACFKEMAKEPYAQSPWEDVIGDDRDVYARFAEELRVRGFQIVRTR